MRSPSSLLRPLIALVLLAAACTAPVDEEDGLDTELIEELQAVVDRSAERATAGTLVRVDTPDGVEELVAGPSDLRTGTELAPGAAFRAASITKIVTATVVLQLAEEGVLDLDADVFEVIPARAGEFPLAGEITARQLLSHTSGIEDYLDFDRALGRVPPGQEPELFNSLAATATIDEGAVTRPCVADQHLDIYAFVSSEPLFPPGTGWAYSNTGYLLLGEVIEAVTGSSLEVVYRQRVLEPLGMDDTWLSCAEEPRAEPARGYHAPDALGISVPGQTTEPVDVTDLREPYWAAGDLLSTAEDLTRLARAVFTGVLFEDDATLQAMLEPSDHHADYGLGVNRTGDGALGHGGLAAGYNSELRYDPELDTVVVVLVNESAVGAATAVSEEISGILRAPR
jgi:D-alanyl-D-alanine carboxypeptidase